MGEILFKAAIEGLSLPLRPREGIIIFIFVI
jgi:hypothetical protein